MNLSSAARRAAGAILACILLAAEITCAHPLTQAAAKTCSKEVCALPNRFDMVLHAGDTTWYLGYSAGEAVFEVHHFGQLPLNFTADQCQHFVVSSDLEQHGIPTCYSLHHGANQHVRNFDGTLTVPIREDFDDRLHIFPRRTTVGQTPNTMTVDELATYLSSRNILFYTGAGASCAAGIYTETQLRAALGVSGGNDNCGLGRAVEDPDAVLAVCKFFGDSIYSALPTPAHHALATLSQHLSAPIFTENFDLLHEHSGVTAFHVNRARLAEQIDPLWLADVEAIVCVGLSGDQRGLLGWYKHYNPNGEIVAIDLAIPSYLGSEDHFVQGDAQLVLPETAVKIETHSVDALGITQPVCACGAEQTI